MSSFVKPSIPKVANMYKLPISKKHKHAFTPFYIYKPSSFNPLHPSSYMGEAIGLGIGTGENTANTSLISLHLPTQMPIRRKLTYGTHPSASAARHLGSQGIHPWGTERRLDG
jgi:hypothetical protein